ncbi:tryptophan synthase subunit alpha [Streptomyces sp. NPDC090442]|uniref:tryptophan synthase subunit alpha n=1 Tax=Streptomyces sp. NPDC090442 TaxID=3365962 RepID=UPI003824CB04
MTDLTLAAAWLSARLGQRRPALGVFLPAGFPAPRRDVEVLRAFVNRGADVLEVAVPYSDAYLDGPEICEAYHRSLRQGTTVADVLETIRQTVATTWAAVVALSYWGPVAQYGPDRFARDLAQAGAAGAMIPDLPLEEAGCWLKAARAAGLHTPQFVSRRADDARLARVCSAASGWVYAPAVDAPTGYQGELDPQALGQFAKRLRQVTQAPVVSGVGVRTPQQAASLAAYVDGVMVGSAVIRPLLDRADRDGVAEAADQIAAFAAAIRTPPTTPPPL